MAYKDSDELKTDERYPLGDYSFRIERTSVPGSTNDKIEAICTDKDGKNARKSIQVPSSTEMLGWYVEANETEATVYAVVKYTNDLDTSPIPKPIISSPSAVLISEELPWAGTVTYHEVTTYTMSDGVVLLFADVGDDWCRWFIASKSNGARVHRHVEMIYSDGGIGTRDEYMTAWQPQTYEGKTAYFSSASGRVPKTASVSPGYPEDFGDANLGNVAWTILYNNSTDDEQKTQLVGRFAIDIKDAGGDGPGSDWIDPGDYDPDWEESDPTHTLYVTVTGALSGRHNDPIEDPSYSYIPANKDTVKDYGCGGDGGHGGGGGAGASTVVIHKFATNQANSKEVTAIARRHGYGSGGGKGGKGGDGCILVYY